MTTSHSPRRRAGRLVVGAGPSSHRVASASRGPTRVSALKASTAWRWVLPWRAAWPRTACWVSVRPAHSPVRTTGVPAGAEAVHWCSSLRSTRSRSVVQDTPAPSWGRQATVQLWATLPGQAGSSRSVRPRSCWAAVAVVASVRSMRVLTAGQSQPSPSRPRVPTTRRTRPWATRSPTARTRAAPVPPRTRRVQPSSWAGRLVPVMVRSSSSSPWSPWASQRWSAVRRTGCRVRRTASESRVSYTRRAPPRVLRAPAAWSPGAPSRTSRARWVAERWAVSVTTTALRRSPRAACSRRRMSTAATSLAREAATRASTGVRPQRRPLSVRR